MHADISICVQAPAAPAMQSGYQSPSYLDPPLIGTDPLSQPQQPIAVHLDSQSAAAGMCLGRYQVALALAKDTIQVPSVR